MKKLIFAFITSFLLSLLGIVCEIGVSVILVIISLLPALLLLLNILFSKRFVSKINHTNVADMQKYLISHRKEAEQTSILLLKKLKLRRRLSYIYTAILFVMASVASVCSGALHSIGFSIYFVWLIYSSIVFFAVYNSIYVPHAIKLHEAELVLQEEEYPQLYKIARRAADALKYQRKITLLMSYDFNARVIADQKGCYVQIGCLLLGILSEDELYCIFLHEFSHCSDKNNAAKHEALYSDWLASDKNIPAYLTFSSYLFSYLNTRYMVDYMLFQYASSVVAETEADRDMAKYGNASSAASALLKLSYTDKYFWESGVEDEVPFYATEQPNPHFISQMLEKFENAVKERHQIWNAMVEPEILSNNATHPTLKMRMETLGVLRAEPVPDDSSNEYKGEVQKALSIADKTFLEKQDTYAKDRLELYCKPFERVNKWKELGEPIVAEEYADLISDLKSIGRHTEAEVLCDRVISSLDNLSAAHAYFIKGCALLHRYDASGIDLIYHALEANHNNMDEGLNEIGVFCCMLGLEEELNVYRERALSLAQWDKDEYSKIGFLSKDDDLRADSMPNDMLQEILMYIRSVSDDLVQNIYLVRKTINENFFTSAFVIQFCGGTVEQRYNIMHKVFRYLDTYPVDWQFSLFDYNDYSKIKFDKIKGSLVYSKTNQNKQKGENQ